MSLVVANYAELYHDLRLLLLNSDIVSSRICDTKEAIGVKFTLINPRARLGYHKDRGFNLPFALSEFIFDVSGMNDVVVSGSINKKTFDYSDYGNTFHGAYGPRISPHLGKIIEILKRDSNSRQAVINIYNSQDMYANTKDIPCTISLQFFVRNKKLDMIVSMRSNDFFWGLQYDLFRFTMLQEVIAYELGVGLGCYHHLAGSLHVYKHHWEMLDKIEDMESVEMPSLNLGISSCFKIAHQMCGLVENADVALDSPILCIIASKFFPSFIMPVKEWASKFITKKE